jgi:hypothetical protein
VELLVLRGIRALLVLRVLSGSQVKTENRVSSFLGPRATLGQLALMALRVLRAHKASLATPVRMETPSSVSRVIKDQLVLTVPLDQPVQQELLVHPEWLARTATPPPTQSTTTS